MFTTLVGTASCLGVATEMALAAYRHKVFVDGLGWQLPDARDGMERDQFDRPDTLYVIANDAAGNICGCARLLTTTKPYLLADVFPSLLNGHSAPASPDVWELSRFAIKSMDDTEILSREESGLRFRRLLAEAARAALAQRATRLITFTALGVERILRKLGVHAHRVGPPEMIAGEPVLALWIELDDQTRSALGIEREDVHAFVAH